MADVGSARSILIKSGPLPAGASFAAAGKSFTVRPLFRSIGQSNGVGVASSATQWHIISAPNLDDAHLWDVCHSLLNGGLGVAGGVDFAEPNLQQQWIYNNASTQSLRIDSDCAMAAANADYPVLDDPQWCRNAAHSAFDGIAIDGAGVRIAHCDTGFDPSHWSVPTGLLHRLQRNFVDAETPNDASDRTPGGLLRNPGHGTGTLSILAGAKDARLTIAPIGAALGSEVVTIRVANSVVLFENSAIAQAFDYVHELCLSGDTTKAIDVITMSMGGLASQAWAEAVNALYDIGVFIVTAAGNNFGNLPTRNIVFPARFRRVVAACGAMADQTPYANLGLKVMAGNYGPDSKMDTAMAAYTPNVPWARFGCPQTVNKDGHGTSSATPQIAAAAALWIQQNRAALDAFSERWMKVEAIRKALFESARDRNRTFFGKGTLHAVTALAALPAAATAIRPQPPDNAFFPLLRTLTGMGMAATPSGREHMLELEALQLSQSKAIEDMLPDPDNPPSDPQEIREIADALASHPNASQALRQALGRSNGVSVYPAAVPTENNLNDRLHLQHALDPDQPVPTRRRLRIFAYDPSMEQQLDTLGLNVATVTVRYEKVDLGPVGEYIEVIDVDPASDACYAPIDLDDARLLMQDGRPPAESSAQFHQQMVYAVSMKTIEHFERALGRVALWCPHVSNSAACPEEYIQRLRIYPHALREANAFYSPDKKALLFGYFTSATEEEINVPGALIFACLSYDIVAHETTHALLDGLHPRYREPTNRDMLAFHEAFADIVALFQHFTVPESVRNQIAKTQGNLRQDNLLAELAVQFGQSTSGRAALRSYVGTQPQRTDYPAATEPHDRGAVLVAAVFDAFLRIYSIRSYELRRLASGGTGVLPTGDIPDALCDALAAAAAKLADRWLDICIRALDYCPPVDLTFGDYLRALITADADAVPDDERSYRVAFTSAFRDRGIYAQGIRSVSVGSLIWEPPTVQFQSLPGVLARVSLSWDLHCNRRTAYDRSKVNARVFHDWLVSPDVSSEELDSLGLVRLASGSTQPLNLCGLPGTLHGIEVHSVRPARRIGLDGEARVDLVIEITQTWHPTDPDRSLHRGGVTLIIDLEAQMTKYVVRKSVANEQSYTQQLAFEEAFDDETLGGNYFQRKNYREPFAMLHRMNPLHEVPS
jgi:subtilisin family serine protease